MTRTRMLVAAAVGLVSLTAAALPAAADHYRGHRPYYRYYNDRPAYYYPPPPPPAYVYRPYVPPRAYYPPPPPPRNGFGFWFSG